MSTDAAQWDPVAYRRYRSERSRPFADLIARIGADRPGRILDLGCGDGRSTATLLQRWPDAWITGVDSSTGMLSSAHALPDRIDWVLADAATYEPDCAADVVVSNAMLQWIPDHESVVTRMASWLAPDGWLAIQVPGNFAATSHVALREIAGRPRWADRLEGTLQHTGAVLDAAGYHELLSTAGLRVDAWETTYVHELSGPDPVLEWTRGTSLRPVLTALDDEEETEFVEAYAEQLRAAYPPGPSGTVRFPFRRIFAVAHREDE